MKYKHISMTALIYNKMEISK